MKTGVVGTANWSMLSPVPMNTKELEIDKLEAEFPFLSSLAFSREREKTLAAGLSVLQAESGVIYEVFPNGSRREVKRIAKPIPVKRGSKFRIP